MLKKNDQLQLDVLQTSLPEDLQQLLFDLHTPEKVLNLEETLNVGEEWQRTYKQLATEMTKSEIARIGEELAKLDEKRKKTSEEEERQNELLKKIVQLRGKVKPAG